MAAADQAKELVALRGLASAIQFLIFGRVSPGIGRAAAWFPVVGTALGAAGAGIYLIVPPPFGAFACVVLWAASGRILNEGKLIYGAAILSAVARWLALENFAEAPGILVVCIAAQAIPRAAVVGMAWVSRPAGTGLDYELASTLTTPMAIAAIAQGVLAAFLCGARAAVVLIVGSFLIAKLVREFFYKRRGGVDGDCLGVTEQLLEIFILAVFACRACAL